MSLQGNLTDLPLIDLMQVLTLQNKTGILSISREFSQAQITFNKSTIYAAFVHNHDPHHPPARLQGEEALFDLLNWPDGQFSFELTSALPGTRNVNVNWDYLVLEHCRRQDEKEQARSLTRLANACPRLVPNPPLTAEITLELEDWQVLLQVNGQVTLQQIANQIRHSLEQVAGSAEKLKQQGLLEYDSPAPAASRSPGGWSGLPSAGYRPGWQDPVGLEAYPLPPAPPNPYNPSSPFGAGPGTGYAPAAFPPALSPRPTNPESYAPAARLPEPGGSYRPVMPPDVVPPAAVAANNREPQAAGTGGPAGAAPAALPRARVQRGLLSGIIAKIRGL